MKNRFGIDWSKAQGTHFWRRPVAGRRMFLRHAGAGLGGWFLLPSETLESVARGAGNGIGTAKNVIFILLAGGPSHVDTFDLKEGAWTRAEVKPETFGELRWPTGLFPKLSEQMGSIAVVRSMRAWALVHGICQTWVQIGRNPLSGAWKLAPHIGSIVSRELRPSNQNNTLPVFLSLNASAQPGAGYLPPEHEPFFVSPGGGGLGNTTHAGGAGVFSRRYGVLLTLDAETRFNADITAKVDEVEEFNLNAAQLMYNADIDRIFLYDAAERARYGNSSFGNACIAARNVLAAKIGTRFVQITLGGWDNHTSIYDSGLNAANPNSVARLFDAALGTLIADLRQRGLLDETLIVALGEFGRTTGPLNSSAGRDHFDIQAALLAGAGVKGGRAVGKTNDAGNAILDPGWSQGREVRPEDIEATIYSALGIDWAKGYTDYPLGRPFTLVPDNQGQVYYPVHELWT